MSALAGFGLRLVPLSQELGELVRTWRNSPEISQFMEFREFITPEMQRDWVNSLKEKPVKYFVIFSGEAPVGLIHLSHIQPDNSSAEAGLFIGDSGFRGTGAALGASVLLLDFAFNQLGIKTVWVKIHRDNIPSQKYNRLLGFKAVSELPEGHFQIWELPAVDFFVERNRLISLISLSDR
jgi:RimJ/RimL family protein N-acetyltransferase